MVKKPVPSTRENTVHLTKGSSFLLKIGRTGIQRRLFIWQQRDGTWYLGDTRLQRIEVVLGAPGSWVELETSITENLSSRGFSKDSFAVDLVPPGVILWVPEGEAKDFDEKARVHRVFRAPGVPKR